MITVKQIGPGTPVNRCIQERALWDMLADKRVMSPDHLFCGRAQNSVPKRRAG